MSCAGTSVGGHLVSVIVPVYRTERYLDDCVTSILSQTHSSIEVVLVDDGSDDGSPALCDAWSTRDARVKVLHRANGGLSAARNSGLDVADGDWIAFVDSDDVVSAQMIRTLHSLAVTSEADVVGCDLVSFHEGSPTFSAHGEILEGPAECVLLRLVRGGRNWEACAKLFRRDLFDSGLRFREGTLYEDLDLVPEIYLRSTRAVHTRSRLYGYRIRSGSIMAESSRVLNPDLITVLDSNIERTKRRFPKGSPERDELIAAYVLHASSKLEQFRSLHARRDNAGYVGAYKRFMRRHLAEVMKSPEISKPYRAALCASAMSPNAFAFGAKAARWTKRTLLPSISRRPSGR